MRPLSLNQRLNNDEVLAVAFQYTIGGKVYQVGEFANDGVDATDVTTNDDGDVTNVVNTNVKVEVVRTVKFNHGRLQIDNFEHVYHGTTPWKGKRWTLSFSLNKYILNHFLDGGSYYYDKFVKAQYRRNMFIAA